MLARELVKISNFRKYYFIISKDDVKERNVEYIMKCSNSIGYGTIEFYENSSNSDVDSNRFYDIGYILAKGYKTNANQIASAVDKILYKDTKQKIFKIHRLENYDGILFIHLRMNKMEEK